jgi:hypothetical protein
MKISAWAPKYIVLTSLAILALVLMVGGASRRAARAYLKSQAAEQAVPVVINKTSSITVTNLTLSSDGIVEFTLSNVSSRVITFYAFAVGEGRIMPLSGIPAGGKTVQKVSASSFDAGTAAHGSRLRKLTILALSFGGGGGEGDPEEVANLEDTTRGMKDQIGSFLPALVRAANSTEAESEENLESLEAAAMQPPDKNERVSPSTARKGGGRS